MKTNIKISNVHFIPAGPHEVTKGLKGWISCILNDRLQLDGLTLRKTRGGRHALSFPARSDNTGRQHYYIKPLDNTARKIIERQIFKILALKEKVS